MHNFTKLSVAASLMMLGNSVFAAEACPETLDPAADYKCVYFDVGTDFDSDGNTVTDGFFELGYSGTLATSVYEAGLATGSKVYDSNITKVLNYYGLSGGLTNYDTVANDMDPLDNSQVALKDTALSPHEKNLDSLNQAIDTERFDATNSFGGGWGLTYEYFFEGTLGTASADFTDGYIDYFFHDWDAATSEQVLRIDITGSQLNPLNFDVFGEVSYDWTGGGNDIYGLASIGDGTSDCTSTLCQDFFNFMTTTPNDFFSLVEGSGITISMKLDTNINPPIPTTDRLVEFTNNGITSWIRQTTLDGSVRFNVPEPGSIALLGLGLVGFGVARRRKMS